jgi:hypothetical protein
MKLKRRSSFVSNKTNFLFSQTREKMNLYVVNSIFSADLIFFFSSSKSKRRESCKRIKAYIQGIYLPNGQREGIFNNNHIFSVIKNGNLIFKTVKKLDPCILVSGKWGCFLFETNASKIFKFSLTFKNEYDTHTFTYKINEDYDRDEASFQYIMNDYKITTFPFYQKKNLFNRTFMVPLIDRIFYS